jgi:hypothetical protein
VIFHRRTTWTFPHGLHAARRQYINAGTGTGTPMSRPLLILNWGPPWDSGGDFRGWESHCNSPATSMASVCMGASYCYCTFRFWLAMCWDCTAASNTRGSLDLPTQNYQPCLKAATNANTGFIPLGEALPNVFSAHITVRKVVSRRRVSSGVNYGDHHLPGKPDASRRQEADLGANEDRHGLRS